MAKGHGKNGSPKVEGRPKACNNVPGGKACEKMRHRSHLCLNCKAVKK